MTQGRGEMRETYPVAGDPYRYRIDEQEGQFTFVIEDQSGPDSPPSVSINIEPGETGEGLCRTESGRTPPFAWGWVGTDLRLWLAGALYIFRRPERRRRSGAASDEASGDILAPMPGAVMEVLVSEGERVERNQTVVVMESMKMELVIKAPRDGIVRRVVVEPGQQVERGMRLLELVPEIDAGEQ